MNGSKMAMPLRAQAWIRGPILTMGLAAVIELAAGTEHRIPNPPALLVLAVVFSAFDGGVIAGLVSAAIAFVYIANFFSEPGQLFHYTDENFRRVLLWAIVLPIMAYLVGLLNRRSARAAAVASGALLQQARLEERARATEANAASERLFRALLDHANDAIEVIDPETGCFLDVNEKACQSHGYSRDEYLRLTVSDVDPVAAAKHWQETREAVRRAGSRVHESQRRRKDGSTFPVEANVAYIELDREYMLAVVRDLAERKKAEQALKSSEAALSQAQVLAGLGHYRWSAVEQRPLAHTDSYLDILGLGDAPFAVQQGGVASVLHPEDRDRVTKEWRAAEAERRGFRIEFRILRPDGRLRYIRDMSEPEPNSAGPVQNWFGTLQDITDFVEREAELRLSQAALLRAEKLAKSAHFQWCAAEGRMMAASEGYYEMLGLTDPAATPGDYPIETRLHQDDRMRVLALYRRAEAEGLSLDHEFRIIRPDGSIRYMREIAQPEFDVSGKLHCHYGTLQDITDMKHAEASLRRNEERYRHLTEITSDWQWETDEEFRVRSYSENYDPGPLGGDAAVIGRALWQIAGVERPEEDETWVELLELVRAHRPIREFRYALEVGNGNFLHRRLNGRPLFAGDGRFTGYLLASRDVTAEANAHKKARAAEELLSKATESISDGIAVYDSDDRLTLTNSRYRGLFLQDNAEDAVGRTFEELVRIDTAKGYYVEAAGREERFVQERLAAHRRSGSPFLFKTKDGHWIQARDNHMPDGSIVAVRTDVTSLIEAKERFHSLADNLPGIVFRRIVHPNGEMRETYVSAGVKKMLGVDPEEFTSGQARLFDYVHHEDRERKLALLKQSMASLSPFTVESERYVRPSGEVRWWQVYIAPRRLSGGSTEFDGIAFDITEQRAATERLQKAQKLEALGQLTSGISHDFNNLLGVIIGNLDLALEHAGRNRQIRELIEAANKSALHGADLTKRLLGFSRGQPVSPETVDLNRLLPQVGQMLRRMLGEEIVTELRLREDLWTCLVDPSQVEDVILNLAINARDAMPAGGTLTIETDNVHFDKSDAERVGDIEPGDFVLLSISDTGKGMPKEVLEHVFEPFYTTKAPGQGTGLGLSQAYGFVKQSKGHIRIYSEVGVGTTVKVYLLRTEAKRGAEPANEVGDRQTPGRETILVVEDNAQLRAIAVQEISQLGYCTLEADGGPTALALLGTHPEIDALFSDVVMPGGMTGYDLARQARHQRPEIRALLTSGYVGKAAQSAEGQPERIEFLSKPYGKRDLAGKLKRLFER